MNEKYIPEPINTDGVALPDNLAELTEILAKNVHEVWAKSRIGQGWTFGRERDDVKKTHPGLVPYTDLSEQEKDYDRNTAIETLKLVIKSGYTIKPE